MRYYLFTSKSKVSEIEEYPAVVLRRDSWDDFGYKTTLELMYYPSQKEGGQAIGPTLKSCMMAMLKVILISRNISLTN